jgi:hypothetical protein
MPSLTHVICLKLEISLNTGIIYESRLYLSDGTRQCLRIYYGLYRRLVRVKFCQHVFTKRLAITATILVVSLLAHTHVSSLASRRRVQIHPVSSTHSLQLHQLISNVRHRDYGKWTAEPVNRRRIRERCLYVRQLTHRLTSAQCSSKPCSYPAKLLPLAPWSISHRLSLHCRQYQWCN